MSRLKTLLDELCPDGVEYKKLGELGTFYGGLSGKSKEDFKDGNAKYITYMNVFSNIAVNTNIHDYVRVGEKEKQNAVKYGDVLFTGSSETPEECGMSSVLTEEVEEKLYLNSFCFGFRFYDPSIMLPGFAKFLFRSHAMRKQIIRTANGVTRFNVSKKKMESVIIPVPPLAVQCEIVRLLDNFAELTADLIAELSLRRTQYEHYRDTLLTFPASDEAETLSTSSVQWLPLGEVCDFQNGFAFKSRLFMDDGFPIVRITNIQEQRIDNSGLVYFHLRDYKENLENFVVYPGDIVIAMSGATTGKIAMNTSSQQYYLNQRVGKFMPQKEKLLNNFLYHILRRKEKDLYYLAGGGAQPNLSSEKLKKMVIPVPPLAEQERIVSLLDRFDALCNDLSSGLPAEIDARRKQYAYYRDRLLTFRGKRA